MSSNKQSIEKSMNKPSARTPSGSSQNSVNKPPARKPSTGQKQGK